jgi:hypothetical protein
MEVTQCEPAMAQIEPAVSALGENTAGFPYPRRYDSSHKNLKGGFPKKQRLYRPRTFTRTQTK